MRPMRKGGWKRCLWFGFLPFLNNLWAEEVVADATLFRPLEQPKEWSFTDAAAWRWERLPGQESTLVLHRPSQYKPPVRSPLNIAWFEGRAWKSFTLTAEVRLELFNEGNNDLCLFFAGKGPREFCYAHAVVRQRFTPPLALLSFGRTARTDAVLGKIVELVHGRR